MKIKVTEVVKDLGRVVQTCSKPKGHAGVCSVG